MTHRALMQWRIESALSMPASRASSRRIPRAFTLIEMMVVIGIVLMLVGLTVGVSAILHRKSETRQVEQMFKILDSALQEWEITAERQLTWGLDGTPAAGMTYDLNSNSHGADQMSALLKRVQASSASKEILARIDPDLLKYDSALDKYSLVDPWGTTVLVLHPGRLPNVAAYPYDNVVAKDTDGTIRTTPNHLQTPSTSGGPTSWEVSEQRFGSCVNRRICFISAGPDRDFGAVRPGVGVQADDIEAARDNIYSYVLVIQ